MSDEIVLLIETREADSEAVAAVAESDAASGLDLQVVSPSEATGRIRELLESGVGPAAIVLGPHLPDPIAVARECYQSLPLVQLVLLALPSNEAELRRRLAVAPRIGTNWTLASAAPDGLARTLEAAVRATRQRRQHRTTLDRVRLSLSAPPPPTDASDYRRLVLSDRYLGSILTHAQEAIFSTDPQGVIRTWNPGAKKLLGFAEHEVLGRTIEILDPGDATVPLGQLVRAASNEALDARRELLLRKANGEGVPVEASVGPVRDDQGAVIGISVIARDVTDRRLAEEALREESRVAEALNETGRALASTLELRNLLQTVTDSATKLSGAAFGAFFYKTVDERGDAMLAYTLSGARLEDFERFGNPRATPLFGPTFQGEGPIRIDDVLQDPRYGQWAPHHGMPEGHLPVRSYLAVSVISRTGDVIGGLFFGHPEPGTFSERTERIIGGIATQAAVAIDNARLYEDVKQAARDRTQLLEAERAARAEAERASLMKDEFLATVSHELRTPLNAILGWAQLLRMGTDDSKELEEGLEAIERNSRAQAQIIEDLLDMSRIISGKVRLDVQLVDLAEVVNAAVESVRPSADAKGITLRKVLDPLAGPVSGDPNRLQQVVWNLLSNALKFTPKGGKISVLVERVNSHLEVTVVDTGAGIAPDFLPHVFERFRQADGSTTRRTGGLGLGLSIVKQLVELHGGTVRAKSAGEGQGATFTVDLPLAPVRETFQRQHPATPSSSPLPHVGVDLSGIKVLLVDDEPDAIAVVRRVLAQCRAEVSTASSADEALDLLSFSRPDVLVSDIGMPVKDGYQFMQEVRRRPPEQGGRAPAIALTAFARAEDRTRAMMAGYQVHISKPIHAHELIATVASLVGRTGFSEG